MSEAGRYRLTYLRLWRHPSFRALTSAEKVLMLYLLTGPQTNRIGLFDLSLGTTSTDLRTNRRLLDRLTRVVNAFGWSFDDRTRIVYIPSWWRWNQPQNRNVLRGNLKDINEIPSCALLDAFTQNTRYLKRDLWQTFTQTLVERLAERTPTQEQVQEQYPRTRTLAAEPLTFQHPVEIRKNSETLPVVRALAVSVLEANPAIEDDGERRELVKAAAARAGIDYSSRLVAQAVDEACAILVKKARQR